MRATLVTFVADVKHESRSELHDVLADLHTRSRRPPYRPFSAIPSLHFASIVAFERPKQPQILVFECNFDGELEAFIPALVEATAADVHAVFACCAGYHVRDADQRSDIAAFLRKHAVRPAAFHVGNFARTRTRITAEQMLRSDVERGADCAGRPATERGAYDLLHRVATTSPGFDEARRPILGVARERFIAWTRLVVSFAAPFAAIFALALIVMPTGMGWTNRLLYAVASVAGVTLTAIALLAAALWWHERRDVSMDPRALDPRRDAKLAANEDQHAQNHLASITVVKPGRFRRRTLRVVLWLTNLIARTSTRGRLSGITSIHFAQWSLIDGGRLLLFLSNYDGGWSAYLDDFVDQAHRGLTAIWSNTEGFPETRFLFFRGARDRTAFKAFARMQQTPTAVWYSAYPDLTVQQIDSNSAIAQGLVHRPHDDDLAGWLHRLGGGDGPRSTRPEPPAVFSQDPEAADTAPDEPLDTHDIQRLVLSSHARLKHACYLVLRVTNGVRAREWLAGHIDDLTTAQETANTSPCALQMAFTHAGLAALGVPRETLNSFPAAFREGMASERFARLLGDVGDTAPCEWQWGGPRDDIHVLLLVYASTSHGLEEEIAARTPAADDGIEIVHRLWTGCAPQTDHEPFGFLDGVGQPVIAGSGQARHQRGRTGHVTVVPAGEFLLGYKNTDGVPPLGPVVPPEVNGYETLPPLPRDNGAPERRDLGRNGSYLVFRQLEQNVEGFWSAVKERAEQLWPGDEAGPTRLASKMVGRWPSGAPLVLHPHADPFACPDRHPRPNKIENNFGFAEHDPDGLRCPLGAHIRRTNPRDSLGTDRDEAREAVNRRRLIRRGRAYMHEDPETGAQTHGLYFICFNADIERQFVFVQHTWVNNPAFDTLDDEVDPFVARQLNGAGAYTIPADPLRVHVPDMRSFVRMRGGTFAFLPGVKALRVILNAATSRST